MTSQKNQTPKTPPTEPKLIRRKHDTHANRFDLFFYCLIVILAHIRFRRTLGTRAERAEFEKKLHEDWKYLLSNPFTSARTKQEAELKTTPSQDPPP